VQVHEAVRQETDQVADQLSKLLRDKNVPFSEVTRNTDTQIKIAGVSPDQITTLRNVVSDSFGTWDLCSSPGEANSYLLNMRPSTVADVQDRTMSQSEDTIRRRIDQLGLDGAFVAPSGAARTGYRRVPAKANPVRAKSVIQAGASSRFAWSKTRIRTLQVAAMGAHNGVLPPTPRLLPGTASHRAGNSGWGAITWWIACPSSTGRDLRTADSTRNAESHLAIR